MPITLQHSLLPQVDPNDLLQLPLGISQVGQGTPQGLQGQEGGRQEGFPSPSPPLRWAGVVTLALGWAVP